MPLLPLLSAGALYGLAMILRRGGAPENRFITVSFLLFGGILGLASAFLWPGDVGVYVNVFGTAAGDFVYRTSIQAIGNPNSDQAHFTIPWILRIPQVYAWISPVPYGAIGIPIQYLYSYIGRRKAGTRMDSIGKGLR
ncbi:MAG: hypothetical protein WBM17_13115 [Anaerolineales bacterium]